jgi:hypothetical protein
MTKSKETRPDGRIIYYYDFSDEGTARAAGERKPDSDAANSATESDVRTEGGQ